MSIESWRAEYCAKFDAKTGLEAIEKEIKIFEGTRKLNLARHHLKVKNSRIMSDDEAASALMLDRNALLICAKYKVNGKTADDQCGKCPVFRVHKRRCNSSITSPFMKAASGADPEPFIELLQEAEMIALSESP